MENSFDEGVCGCLWVLCATFGCRKEGFYATFIGHGAEKGAKKHQHRTKRDQNEPRNLQKHVLRNGNEKERKKGVPSSIYWLPFGSHFPLKIQPKDHSKLDLEKH